jgi:predicted DNA-binding transcriptional regulator
MDAHLDKMRDMISEQPRDLELLGQFQASVLALRTLGLGPNEMKYIDCLIRCSTALRISGTNGELAIMHRNKFALRSEC